MTDAHESTEAAANESLEPTAANAVTNPTMAPMDEDAGGPTVDKNDAFGENGE